jgi:hypothetical protein
MSTPFGSPKQALHEQLFQFYDIELQQMSSEIIDTLEPSVISMEATQLVLQMLIELAEHIKLRGQSDRAGKSAKRLTRLLELICKFDKVTGNMAKLKTDNRELWQMIYKLRAEKQALQTKIDNIIAAEQF